MYASGQGIPICGDRVGHTIVIVINVYMGRVAYHFVLRHGVLEEVLENV